MLGAVDAFYCSFQFHGCYSVHLSSYSVTRTKPSYRCSSFFLISVFISFLFKSPQIPNSAIDTVSSPRLHLKVPCRSRAPQLLFLQQQSCALLIGFWWLVSRSPFLLWRLEKNNMMWHKLCVIVRLCLTLQSSFQTSWTFRWCFGHTIF